MTYADLIQAIALTTGLQTTTVRIVLDEQARVMAKALKDGKSVGVPGVGRLTTTTRSARPGRNFATGELVEIPARTVVKFNQSGDLKLD